MARTIAEIEAALEAQIAGDPVLSSLLDDTSEKAEYRMWINEIAVAQWALENAQDFHKQEVADIISQLKPHTPEWYVAKAKAFQNGVALPPDTDVYPVLPPVDPTVLIIKQAAAIEFTNLVRIKVAKDDGTGVLIALSSPELSSFTIYMQRIKDAGVRLQCTSGPADTFQPSIAIFYDPLVLKYDGSRIDGTSATPVKDAVNAFLENILFNGKFIFESFNTAMQQIPGVIMAYVPTVQAFYGITPPVVINLAVPPEYTPDAGYMALDDAWFAANVTYIAYNG